MFKGHFGRRCLVGWAVGLGLAVWSMGALAFHQERRAPAGSFTNALKKNVTPLPSPSPSPSGNAFTNAIKEKKDQWWEGFARMVFKEKTAVPTNTPRPRDLAREIVGTNAQVDSDNRNSPNYPYRYSSVFDDNLETNRIVACMYPYKKQERKVALRPRAEKEIAKQLECLQQTLGKGQFCSSDEPSQFALLDRYAQDLRDTHDFYQAFVMMDERTRTLHDPGYYQIRDKVKEVTIKRLDELTARFITKGENENNFTKVLHDYCDILMPGRPSDQCTLGEAYREALAQGTRAETSLSAGMGRLLSLPREFYSMAGQVFSNPDSVQHRAQLMMSLAKMIGAQTASLENRRMIIKTICPPIIPEASNQDRRSVNPKVNLPKASSEVTGDQVLGN